KGYSVKPFQIPKSAEHLQQVYNVVPNLTCLFLTLKSVQMGGEGWKCAGFLEEFFPELFLIKIFVFFHCVAFLIEKSVCESTAKGQCLFFDFFLGFPQI